MSRYQLTKGITLCRTLALRQCLRGLISDHSTSACTSSPPSPIPSRAGLSWSQYRLHTNAVTHERVEVVLSPVQQDIRVAVAYGMIPAAALARLAEGDDVLLVSREHCVCQVHSASHAMQLLKRI